MTMSEIPLRVSAEETLVVRLVEMKWKGPVSETIERHAAKRTKSREQAFSSGGPRAGLRNFYLSRFSFLKQIHLLTSSHISHLTSLFFFSSRQHTLAHQGTVLTNCGTPSARARKSKSAPRKNVSAGGHFLLVT